MIKSISQLSLPLRLSQKECIELVYKTGFEGYEPVFKLKFLKDKDEINEIKKRAEDKNIRITSVATELNWRYSLSSEDKSIRKKGIDIGKAEIDFCKQLGASISLIIPGTYMGKESYYDGLERLKDSIYQLLEYGSAVDVTIGI